ncbi:hypothetical protein ACJMK2_032731 [Sinanodonta woodiana]|uniref:NTR domain-containing protein n=1 Tax=Sinanodonta woodiana TaxID=1069815 RepID=A0ABD3X381_SINWO
MEWKMLFVQSILILLGVIQVTNACTCNKISWKEALCPKRDKTVVRASAISVERLNHEGNVVDAEASAPNARYQMRLEQTYRTGSTPLIVKKGIFTMMFPLDNYLCGLTLTLNKEYVIVGTVHQNGILNSNTCQKILPMDEVDGKTKSLLNGQSKIDCTDL